MTHLNSVVLHGVHIFRTCLAFTAWMLIAISARAQPVAPSVDNDATLTFADAAFVQAVGWPTIARAQKASERLGPGVEFERWRLETAQGPLLLSIVRAELHNPYVRLAVGSRNDMVVGPGEALTSMADRHAAIAGINADYYDISGSGEPTNLLLQNGVVQHAPNGRAALLVGEDNRITFGPVAWHSTFSSPNGSVDVQSVNDWSASTGIMLFTQQFGLAGAANADAEVTLGPAGGGNYRVLHVAANQPTFLPLLPDEIGLAAHADQAATLLNLFHPGDVVTVHAEWSPAVAGLREGVGGGPVLLRDGQPYEDPNPPSPEERDVRYPLTGAGLSRDGATLILIVVDGRAPGRSIGITRPMLGALFAALGASDAMAFDSGGSSEMVIRRIGDTGVSVANQPSDGRERSIADSFLVINSAPVGSAQRLVLRARARGVLVGSHLSVTAQAIDENDQPAELRGSVHFEVTPAAAARIAQQGTISALHPGTVIVSARSGDASGTLTLRVVTHVDALNILQPGRAYPPGAQVPLAIRASMHDGGAIAVDSQAIAWSSAGDAGTITSVGVFHATDHPARAIVVARAGGNRAQAELLVGAHHVVLQPSLNIGDTPGLWHLAVAPKDLAAALEFGKTPDGDEAAHLSYDFGTGTVTRAAMAESSVAIAGEPLAVTLDVYGDGSGAWLRGAYRNSDGISDTVTFARRIDWSGWRTVGAVLPPRVRWPIAWTRVYVVAPPGDKGSGDVWLRNLGVWYAGP